MARVKAAESRVANLLEAAEREISAQDYSWLKVLAVVVHRDLGTLTGEDGVFDRRREELRLEASIRGALSNHDVLASRYVASASSLFADMEERITNERDVLAEFVRQGSSVLIGLAVLASLAGALIFFYVRYGVLNRLVALQQAMLRRTRGEKAPIPRKGDDEINDMADGISYFVNEISRREAQFKGFAESSSDYFWETDTDFRFTYFSDRFSEMTSVPAEKIIGLKIEETPNLEVDPDDWQRVTAAIVAHHPFRDLVLIRRRDDGTPSYRSLSGVPIFDENGTYQGYRGVGSDITATKQAEEVLRRARDEAEALAEAKSEFVAMVSHEIRTPMNGVLGMARLLRDTALDGDQKENAGVIVTSGESLLRLVDDLLDLSKLEAGGLELETIPFLAEDVVNEAVAIMSSRAVDEGLALSSEIDPGLPAVLIGDPHRLRQVLLNLVSNAVKFTEEGSVAVRVNVADRRGEDVDVTFAVTDTGKGISTADQEKLFAPYAQGAADVARRYGGTGLGLPICRRLVEKMGGRIEVISAEGEGSTFRFKIRLREDRTSDPATLREQSSALALGTASLAPTAHPLNILQVEDIETNRLVIDKTLTAIGHRVVNVANGREALDALAGESFDLVVMDRHMPIMNGIDATRRIRAMDEPLRSIPILGVTAGANESEVRACVDAGMDDCLTKPVEAHELIAALNRLVGNGGHEPSVIVQGRVLVIDDSSINRTVAQKQLAKLGVPCDLVDNGADALRMIDEADYAAILVDVVMPKMDGVEFTEQLRRREHAQSSHRRLPIIAVTGRAAPEDRKRYVAAGMDDILVKPVVINKLSAVLGTWLSTPVADAGGSAPFDEEAREGSVADRPPSDLGRLSQIFGANDEAELLGMLDLFVREFPTLLGSLEDAVAKRDPRSVHNAAHAAKSAAAYAAAIPLSELLDEIEGEASGAEWKSIGLKVAAVETEFARFRNFIDDHRDRD